MAMVNDSKGRPVPVLAHGLSEDITTSGTSQQTAALAGKLVRLVCTAACYYEVGSSPTAAAGSSVLLPANVVVFEPIPNPGDKVAVIQVSEAGTFNATIYND